MKRICRKIIFFFRPIVSDFWHNWLASSIFCPARLRTILYRISGNKIGKKCRLCPRSYLGYGPGKLCVGGGTFINYSCWFDLGNDIFIGENCNIGMNVHFINETHEIGDQKRRAGKGISKPIFVGSGSWIGADSIIMPGVHIGEGCVIGAGSLVLNDTQEHSVYVGRPARKIKTLAFH